MLLGSLLANTLSLAVVLPGLLLQGVATRPRAEAADGDVSEVEPSIPGGAPLAEPQAAETASDGSAPDGQAGLPDQPDGGANLEARESLAAPANRPRRGRAEPAVPSARPPRAGAAPGRQGRKAGRPAIDEHGHDLSAPSAELDSPADAKLLPDIGADADEAGFVALEPAADDSAEGEARGPVTFAEVQAAHEAAARGFRDLRRMVNEAYLIIGRLNVERYEAQLELAELKGLPLPERPPERSWKAAARPSSQPKSRPLAPAAARRLKRKRELDEEEDAVDVEEVKAIGRRRQRVVIGSLLAAAAFGLVYWLSGSNWLPNILDRQVLTDMAGIGIMMQVFFLIFFLFRLTTLTGKGKSWLFPTPEEESWKRRRKRVRGR